MGNLNHLDQQKWALYKKSYSNNYQIYVSHEIEGIPKNELFPRTSPHPTLPDIDLISNLKLTPSVENSDYVLVPHAWRHIKGNPNYLAYLHNLSKETPILMVNSGDISPRCNLSNTIELRTFLHPWEKNERKIVLPYPVKGKIFKIRKWKPKPTISFMGYVPRLGPGSLFGENIQGLTSPIKSSVYLNRKLSVHKLEKLTSVFEVKLTKRSSFTAYSSNPDLEKLIEEYNSELNIADYILCPRGAANTSMRFYESLSAGRTPILVESGGSLPEIKAKNFWSSNVVTVNLFRDWTKQILDDWLELSNGNAYEVRQIENNKIFSEELRFEKYLNTLFQRYLLTAK
jgi:hypothetical protein